MGDDMEFKERIKELRLEHMLTQAQLASTLEKGEAAIRTWETGRAKPDSDTLIKLAKIFNCSVDYLLGISASKKISPMLEIDSEINKLNNLINQKKDELAKIEIRRMEIEESLKLNTKEIYQKQHELANLSEQIKILTMQKRKMEELNHLQREEV
ncbi:MAG: helix-turn-helix domain-containing protein [Lachnospiraceae bacterium]|nr:helix-turn-helix domain-containing protein [Lachnospiraceae bacterium]